MRQNAYTERHEQRASSAGDTSGRPASAAPAREGWPVTLGPPALHRGEPDGVQHGTEPARVPRRLSQACTRAAPLSTTLVHGGSEPQRTALGLFGAALGGMPRPSRAAFGIAPLFGLRCARRARLRRHHVIGRAWPLTHCASTSNGQLSRGRHVAEPNRPGTAPLHGDPALVVRMPWRTPLNQGTWA